MRRSDKKNTTKYKLRGRFQTLSFSNFSFVVVGLFIVSVAGLPLVVAQENKLTKIAKLENQKNDSVFVVSDEELKSFSNTSELIREVKLLRKDNAALVDYSKKLREKFKDLEKHYSQNGEMRNSYQETNNHVAENEAQIDVLKKENQKLSQQIQNLKTEYEALKIEGVSLKEENKTLKDDYAKYKTDITGKVGDGEKQNEGLQKLLTQKTEESRACLEQVEQSQKLVLQIPELEKMILGLRNELLMRKSAAELLGSSEIKSTKAESIESIPSQGKSLQPRVKDNKAVRAAKMNPEMNSDIMIVEIIADKVALRAGPGQENSTIMDIAKGARLTVEAREGEWLRINSPTGGRAYVNSALVKVIDNGQKVGNVSPVAARTDVVSKEGIELDASNKFVPMEAEPIKPPLPQKPVKRSGRNRGQFQESDMNLNPTSSLESAALEAIKKGMNGE